MKFRNLFALALALSGCANLNGYKVQEGPDGIYRAVHPDQVIGRNPETALRKDNGKLAATTNEANAVLARLQSPMQLIENASVPDCSSKEFYRANAAQAEAVAHIQAREFPKAAEALNRAEEICAGIGKVTAQDYYRAMALAGEGKTETAKAAAMRFLEYSSAYRPELYYQHDGPGFDEDQKEFIMAEGEFRSYRDQAKAFIEGGIQQLEFSGRTVESARFYPNSFFRPGGNERQGVIVLPVFGFGGVYGSMLGAGGYYQFGKWGVGGTYANSSTTGSFINAKVRSSLYESDKRDLNIDAFLAGRTNKQVSYTWRNYSYEDVKVESSSFDPGAGLGASYRLLPGFGFAGEGAFYSNRPQRKVYALGSLYSFYDLGRAGIFSLNGGYIQNRPMVSVAFAFVHIGYNFKEKGLDVLVQGLNF